MRLPMLILGERVLPALPCGHIPLCLPAPARSKKGGKGDGGKKPAKGQAGQGKQTPGAIGTPTPGTKGKPTPATPKTPRETLPPEPVKATPAKPTTAPTAPAAKPEPAQPVPAKPVPVAPVPAEEVDGDDAEVDTPAAKTACRGGLRGVRDVFPDRWTIATHDDVRHIHCDSALDVVELTRPTNRENIRTKRLWDGVIPSPTHRDITGWGPRYWGKAASLAQFKDMLTETNPEGADLIRNLIAGLEHTAPPAVEIRRRSQWKDDGDEVDVQRMRNGELDRMWWGSTRSHRTVNPIVKIYVDNMASWIVDAKDLFWCGAAAAAAAELAERAGWRVELISIASSNHGDVTACSTWTVKRSNEPLDLESIAASLCTSSALRTAHFAMQEMTLTPRSSVIGGVTFQKPSFVTEEDVWMHGANSEHEAKAQVLNALEQLKKRTEA